ncbi:hypothetical protein KOR42_03800 [Thalassoglobus neptunius]|uniref:Uncharacterized protein n=2 Tax=Thalassoglobus neptunius TaxID=1938619 RepID=A0A5C5X468_9PLAN|nr:hypothetical protein KOR42_03800 [Thalassoglobus neptunius]
MMHAGNTSSGSSQTRWVRLVVYCGLACLWGLAALSAVSFRDRTTELDHQLCGVWGCSPPVAAVVSCHLVWGLILLPLAIYVCANFSIRIVRITGMTTVCVACCAILVLVVYEYFHWYTFVQPASRVYFGRRIALSLFSQIDFPIIPLLLMGLGVWWVSFIRPTQVVSPANHEREHLRSSEELASS